MVFAYAAPENLVIRNHYDPTDNIRNTLRFHGTILPRTLCCTELWIAVGSHFILFFIAYFSQCTPDDVQIGPNTTFCITFREAYRRNPITISDSAVIVNLVVLFLVLYNSSCYSRFVSLYQIVCVAGGKLHAASLFLRDYFDDPLSRWQVMRYMLASHRIFFYLVRKQISAWHGYAESSSRHPGSWEDFTKQHLLPCGLLKKEEADSLKEHGGNMHKTCLSWAAAALERIIDEHDSHPKTGYTFVDGHRPVRRESWACRGTWRQEPAAVAAAAIAAAGEGTPNVEGFNWIMDRSLMMANTMDCFQGALGAMTQAEEAWLLPTPFYYFHLLNLCLAVCLGILSWAFLLLNGGAGSPISLVAYPFCALILVALRETASSMSDPFGEGESAFRLEAFQESVYRDCRAICLRNHPPFYRCIGNREWCPSVIVTELCLSPALGTLCEEGERCGVGEEGGRSPALASGGSLSARVEKVMVTCGGLCAGCGICKGGGLFGSRRRGYSADNTTEVEELLPAMQEEEGGELLPAMV